MSSRVAITNSSGLTQLEKRNYEDGSGLNAHRHQQQRNATVQWRVFQVFSRVYIDLTLVQTHKCSLLIMGLHIFEIKLVN